jgi:FG-GAP repeat
MRKMRSWGFCILTSVLALSQFSSASERQENSSLLSLPKAAQSAISAALGRDLPSYGVDGQGGNFHASNAQHNLALDFTAEGVAVHSGNSLWRLALRGYGYGPAIRTVSATAPQASFNRVEYRRGPLTEWYVNGPVGLEQGFTLNEPPGEAKGQPLTIALALSGDFTSTVDDAGDNGLTLKKRDGQARLRYIGLTAHDATGHELRSWLELQGKQLLLKVADTTARYPVVIDPLVQLAKLTASHGMPGNQFGTSVSLSGNTVVVGAPSATIGSNAQQGAAYVFVKPASGWANMTQTARLTAANGAAYDLLGFSVAISGNTVVAGAYNGHGFRGAAYVFVKPASGWASMTQTAELTAAGYVQLGWSVAISANTNTVVAGAIGKGAAYVFVKPASGWADMTPTAELTASDRGLGDFFGGSVAISGNTAVAGAKNAHTRCIGRHCTPGQGAAYVFVEQASGWANMTQTAKLTASDGMPGNQFGISVSLSGNTVVAGASSATIGSNAQQGAAYVFVKPASGWANMTQTAKLTASDGRTGDLFGSAVAISRGKRVVAGAPQNPSGNGGAGVAYTFVKPNGGWRTTSRFNSKLTASDALGGWEMGASVSVSGNTVVAGAPYANGIQYTTGAAYVFGP